MKTRLAQCSCGQLRVTCVGDPAIVGICCCAACQRRTGSAYSVGAYFPKEQVTAIEGASKIYERGSDAGRWVRFRFCTECGVTVCWEAERRPGIVGITFGAFPDPSTLEPVVAVWASQKASWTPLPDGIAVHEQQL